MTGVRRPAAWRRSLFLTDNVQRELGSDALPVVDLALGVTGWVVDSDGSATLYVEGLRYAAHAGRDPKTLLVYGWTTIAGFDAPVTGVDLHAVRRALQRLVVPFVGASVVAPR